MKKTIILLTALFLFAGCGKTEEKTQETAAGEPVQEPAVTQEPVSEEPSEEEKEMILKINGEVMDVTWEENESVNALAELAQSTLVIDTHMYGGWEQVGSIGRRLPSADVNTTAVPGDIMLYSSDQIVIFYGNNSWAYTKLGHISSTQEQLETLLSAGNARVELSME
jgi:hypothetical protein